MKKIFVCSPLRGNIEENQQKAKAYSQFVINQGHIPITPHLYLTQFFDDNIPEQRENALKMAQEMLKDCNEVWVFGEKISEGMQKEINLAKSNNIPVLYSIDQIKEIAEIIKHCVDISENIGLLLPKNRINYSNEQMYEAFEIIKDANLSLYDFLTRLAASSGQYYDKYS